MNTVKKIFNSANVDTTLIDSFMQLLEMPDDKFEQIYPELKKKLFSTLASSGVQKQMLEQIDSMPDFDYDTEKKAIEDALLEIENSSDLSLSKKDMVKTMFEQTTLLALELYKNPRQRIKVKIQKISPDAILPIYAHDSDAGADIFAVEDTDFKPHETKVVKTGIKVAIPKGYEIQIRPRSGLSLKTNLRVANCVGTIDADYRGEVGVILQNTGNLSIKINKGDKIAQMVISPVPMIEWEEVNELDNTDRGEGGFGSTGA